MDNILIDILFCVMFALVLFIALRLLPRAGISLRRFSIPSLFVIFYLMSVYIAILLLYFGLDSYALSLGVVNRTIIWELFIYSSVSLIMVILGFIYGRQVLGFNTDSIRPRKMVGANQEQRVLVFCLFLLCVIVLLIYLRRFDSIAMFHVFNDDIAGAAVARSKMGTEFEGTYWRYSIFFRDFLDYCVLFFFADYLMRRRRISFLIFGASFFVAAFSALMAIEKGPLSHLLVMLYLIYAIYKGGNYWQPIVKYVVISIFIVQIVLYIYFMGVQDITSAFEILVGRLFTGQIIPAYFYLDIFPRYNDYLWGASFPNPGGILPFKNFPLTQEVSTFMFKFKKDVVGTAPTVFWAEIYANFGPIGIIPLSFLVGIGLLAVSYFISQFPLSPTIFAATVYFAMHYRTLTGTGLSSYVFDIKILLIAAIAIIVLRSRKMVIRRSIRRLPIIRSR